MRIPAVPLLTLYACVSAAAQTTAPTPGSGAPTAALTQSFIQAFFRNNFNNLVAPTPLGNVKALGSQGLVQEFADAKVSTNKYALIKSNINQPALAGGADLFQMYPGLYSYYTSVGPTTAGYPTTDTLNCPALVSQPGNSCQYQLFDKPYALFVYAAPVLGTTTNFSLAAPFYAKWQTIGGIQSAGPPTTASTTITSASGIAATVQTFDQAQLFNMTSGVLTGRLIAVGPGVYPTYAASGGYTGPLGLPTTDEQILANGHKKQPFENGSIEYDPTGATPPILHNPINAISISPSGPFKLNLADTVVLTATVFDSNGQSVTDRSLVWTTSNSTVLNLQPHGTSISIKAIAGGIATVTASSEGHASTPISFVVSAPCCGLGEGAPTPAVQQAFADAASRNHLQLVLPAALPVSRAGSGYVQTLQDSAGAPYLIAFPDKASAAYVVSGALLTAYLQFGGPSGALGYAASDANAAGRQLFQNQAALAGSPVQLVSGAFLTKWAALNYESGAAGNPAAAQSTVLSPIATLGIAQQFTKGIMAQSQTGPQAGKVFFSGGLIGQAYAGAGGPAGSLGFPLSDEYTANARNRQDFESGYADYAPGDTAAQLHPAARKPLVTATPPTVLAGSRVRLALGGFLPGASLKVSVTGQPDFSLTTASGAYTWTVTVPSGTKSGTLSIHAEDTASPDAADGYYTVAQPFEINLQLTKASGDAQTGAPGSSLRQPLDLLVKDSGGNPVPGVPVQFNASPGATLATADSSTDANGHARATLKLPSTEGLVLVSADAGKQVANFSAQAQHFVLTNFPRLTELDGPAGSLLAASAAILKYFQDTAQLPSPNGPAGVAEISAFLRKFCVPDSSGAQICDGFWKNPDTGDQVPNLWRLAPFVGGNLDVSIEKPGLATIRDLLGQGMPLLIATSSGAVAAIGVNADGSIAIMDPSPANKTNLNDYLAQGSITGVARLIPRAPAPQGFVVSGTGSFRVLQPAGSCSDPFGLPLQAIACDGSASQYEIDTTGSTPFTLTLTDLSNPGSRSDIAGSGPAAFAVARQNSHWMAAPASINFTVAGIVNAASYTPAIAPGSLIAIFGSGLSSPPTGTSVQIGGQSAPVVAATDFQVAAVVPLALSPGSYDITITNGFGSATQTLALTPVAPAIFVIVNSDGALNTPDHPVKRGDIVLIYCTGLGSSVATDQVGALLSNVLSPVNFAGPTASFPGLYQINWKIPLATPPGINQSLTIQQSGTMSNTVPISIL